MPFLLYSLILTSMAAGPTIRAIIFRRAIFFADHIQGRATGFITKRDDESKDGEKDEDRVQLDVVFTY